MIDRNVRAGACETYWLETSASRGRVVPRAYAAGILALARRHGFRRLDGSGLVLARHICPSLAEGARGWIGYGHSDGREVWFKRYEGNCY